MLAPPPAPSHELSSWRQGVSLIRQRNNSLKQSLATVDVANARARQSLSASLPVLSARAGIEYELLRGDRSTDSAGNPLRDVNGNLVSYRAPQHHCPARPALAARPVFAPALV